MTPRTYETAEGFKAALEDRLRRQATGIELQRRRQLVVFQRMLSRIDSAFGTATVLKGGFALEIRLEQARSTRDLDLALLGSDERLLERIQAAGQLDLKDFMTFEIQPHVDHPEITGDGVVYGGKRFRAECRLAGKLYGTRFGLDIVLGGQMWGSPTVIDTEPFLEFAGIPSPAVRVLPIETHVAEKLHAYTLPRTTTNMRVRDLPDLALLATATEPVLHAERIRGALGQTFATRQTHALPRALPEPPPVWRDLYATLAEEHGLAWRSLDVVTDAARRFLDPVLGGDEALVWDRGAWAWRQA